MLTQQRPLNSTSVTSYQEFPGSVSIYLAGNKVGTAAVLWVSELAGNDLKTAQALGLNHSCKCYRFDGQIYADFEMVKACVIGSHLAATAHW